jgi:nicotinate-nucleotide adenylyltransferase
VVEFFRRAPGAPRRLGILSGTFNPPTRAHLALARAALAEVDEVLFVLPRVFPHKPYEGASFEQRIEMLVAACAGEPRFSIGATGRGLFIEIAGECRREYPGATLAFLCGRDAAERIVNWDYGRPGAFAAMLDVFELLVAARGGDYVPPEAFASRIHTLQMDANYDEVSATEVRDRMGRGASWEELVPPEIVPMVRKIYCPDIIFPPE